MKRRPRCDRIGNFRLNSLWSIANDAKIGETCSKMNPAVADFVLFQRVKATPLAVVKVESSDRFAENLLWSNR